MNPRAGRPERSGRPAWLSRAELRHRAWRYRLRTDPDEIRWMLSVLRPGDAAVDIGAYKGGYTYWMREAVGDSGSVLAFEPQPGAAAMLRRYVGAFEWINVSVMECALSSRSGARPLLSPASAASPAASLVGASLPPGASSYDVFVDTLDRQLAERGVLSPIGLIKCDVEGHELDVFLGAQGTISDQHPPILVECESRHLEGVSMQDVFGHLRGLGYEGFFFDKGDLVDVARFDASVHQVERRKPYVNNFVFLPTGWRRGA